MKKSFVIIVWMTLIASGCVTRNFNSNMDLGKSQLHEENYLEAHEAFELAYKEAKTTKAKELMDLSGFLADGMKNYEDQVFKSAQVEFNAASSYKAKSGEGKFLVSKAKEMISVSQSDNIEPGDGTDDDSNTGSLKSSSEKQAGPANDKALSENEAEKLVRAYVDMNKFPHLQIKYAREDKKGNYIFQVYEADHKSKGSGHRATWGWYGVNAETKAVFEVM
ncbi:hypothetical protein [Peribacillus sp. SI8-4]|uniref:hypothetical protein n=1 Tax=Peribacillus sp. SI8-4 TaxID=3048009 RepID=UPI0025565B03|nr:hypothetical protein [Peribacillus sp. SI8-4]